MPIDETSVVLERARFDAVIFDMDGVVTDTARVHAAAWKATFDDFLQSATDGAEPQRPFSDADYRSFVDGKHRDDGVASFLASRGLVLPRGAVDDAPGSQTVWAVANRKNAAFQATIAREGVQAFPSTVALVQGLQARGFGTAVISASRNCAQILNAAGVGDLFSVRVDGIEMERLGLAGKPSPAVFLEAMRRIGAVVERTVVVEDAVAGVQAGRDGNFALVIGVDRTGDAAALAANGADVVVADLAAVHLDAPVDQR